MKKFVLLSVIILASITAAKAQTIYYVDGSRPDDAGAGTSWATAKKFVQSAINLASTGNEVWVAKGTYKPTTGADRTISINLKDGVKLYGGFLGTETSRAQRNEIVNVSILSGDLLGNDAEDAALTGNGENSFRVVAYGLPTGYPHIDGFTIKGGTGMNRGAGLGSSAESITIENCIFLNNIAADAGSALLMANGGGTVKNCVFSNNRQNSDRGSVMAVNDGAVVTMVNCLIVNNTGTMFLTDLSAFANISLTNCTIAKNFPITSPTDFDLSFTDCDLRGCIWISEVDQVYRVRDVTYFSNFYGFSCRYSFADFPGRGNNDLVFQLPFQNQNNAIGSDGLWRSADDGYRINCIGTNSIDRGDLNDPNKPTLDITGNPRTGSRPDAGAYEGANSTAAFNAIPTATTISFATQTAGLVRYSTCLAEIMAINATSPSTVSGPVSVKVWVDTIQDPNYVKRHYQAVPATNPTTATGVVTLYFTQQEFTDFNAVNSLQLPIDAADGANNKANLRIERRSGSSNAHGTPNSYAASPAPLTITPTSVTWNATAARWEVVFTTNGFGGYFAKTLATVLPLRLITFNGSKQGVNNKLQWTTENEMNTKSFDVERSADGVAFSKIGLLSSRNTSIVNSYDFMDTDVASLVNYYRLKLTDNDGKFTYSNVIKLSGNNIVSVYPNPPGANNIVNITTPESFRNTQFILYNAQGQQLISKIIISSIIQLDLSRYAKGSYTLKFADGTAVSVIRN